LRLLFILNQQEIIDKSGMKQGFLLRREYFGSIAYCRDTHQFYSFDDNGTEIFFLAARGRSREIFERNWPFSSEDLTEFLNDACGLGLLDSELRLNGKLCRDHSTHGRLSAPLRIYWGVTYQCNARCRHCLADAGRAAPAELTLRELKKAADDLCDLGVCEVTLGGGEPLMRRDILPFIEYLRRCGIEVELTTNAFLASRDLARELNGLKLRHVDVSFDGATRETFDFIRGSGTFEKALRGLRILCEEMECGVEMHVTGMRPVLDELSALADLAASAGCRGIGFLKVRPVGRLLEFPDLLISPGEFVQAVKRLEDLCGARGINGPGDLHYDEIPGKDLFVNFGCVGGNTTCWIDGEGRVAPCSYYQYLDARYVGGNLKEQQLGQIWHESGPFGRVRTIRGNRKCSQCRFLNTCRGGCRVLGKIFYGRLNAPDPYCAFEPDDEIFSRYMAKGNWKGRRNRRPEGRNSHVSASKSDS
jgi:radical SAM protein with 4Fe4S-binding SPASM domain